MVRNSTKLTICIGMSRTIDSHTHFCFVIKISSGYSSPRSSRLDWIFAAIVNEVPIIDTDT